MKILIVEDENLAFERLTILLNKLNLPCSIQHAKSIKQAVELIQNNKYDLAFFDIELSDGLSFEIMEQVSLDFPIIYTTAYNQYAIQAFKHNSVDYLLKPIDKHELEKAIEKYKRYWATKESEKAPVINEQKLIEDFRKLLKDDYKKRFTIKIGEHIRIVEAKDISLVYNENKATYIRARKDVLVDYSLDKMMEMLSPKQFFRISRKYIVALDKITDIIAYSNSRLKVVLNQPFHENLIVSREKVSDFKIWLEGEA